MHHSLKRVLVVASIACASYYSRTSFADCSGPSRTEDDGSVECPSDDAGNPFLNGGQVIDEDGNIRWVAPNYFDAFLAVPGIVENLGSPPRFDLSQIVLGPDPFTRAFVPQMGENEVARFQDALPYQDAQDAVETFIHDAIGGSEVVQGYNEKAELAGIFEVQSAHAAVHIWPHFRFTQTPSVVFTQNGEPTDNSVTASLDAQAEISFDVFVDGETSIFGIPSGTATGTARANALIGVHAKTDVSLALHGLHITPTVATPVVTFSDDGGTVAWGLAGDGPVGWLLNTALVLGLHDEVGKNLNSELDHEVHMFLPEAQTQAQLMITNDLMPRIHDFLTQVQSAQDGFLMTSVPGGMTLGDLFASTAQVDLRTRVDVPARANLGLHGVTVSAALRLTQTAGTGSISGKVLIPKTSCALRRSNYVNTQISTAVNTSLTAGASCAKVLNGAELFRIYLGEDAATLPDDVVDAQVPLWATAPDVIYSGTLEDLGNAFACKFEVLDLPSLAILVLGPASQGSSAFAQLSPKNDVYLYSTLAAGAGVLLDGSATPTSSTNVVIGAAGPALNTVCGVSAGSPMAAAPAVPGSDPSGCPSCGFIAANPNLGDPDPYYVAPPSGDVASNPPWSFYADGPDFFLADPSGEVSKFPTLSAFYQDHENYMIATPSASFTASPGVSASFFKEAVKVQQISAMPRTAVIFGTLSALHTGG